ncbi:hypothetical protein NDU88_002414 [Pleurodeles waltl]|uniref:Uncharacterized protein n=1 Tax=Pleurodeles waltl TaxID=8319 RepID=A0AAV7VAG8_PLEWA|nr:hypothetical protein NDU88_002414 [Pleurodeles waltl]
MLSRSVLGNGYASVLLSISFFFQGSREAPGRKQKIKHRSPRLDESLPIPTDGSPAWIMIQKYGLGVNIWCTLWHKYTAKDKELQWPLDGSFDNEILCYPQECLYKKKSRQAVWESFDNWEKHARKQAMKEQKEAKKEQRKSMVQKTVECVNDIQTAATDEDQKKWSSSAKVDDEGCCVDRSPLLRIGALNDNETLNIKMLNFFPKLAVEVSTTEMSKDALRDKEEYQKNVTLKVEYDAKLNILCHLMFAYTCSNSA